MEGFSAISCGAVDPSVRRRSRDAPPDEKMSPFQLGISSSSTWSSRTHAAARLTFSSPASASIARGELVSGALPFRHPSPSAGLVTTVLAQRRGDQGDIADLKAKAEKEGAPPRDAGCWMRAAEYQRSAAVLEEDRKRWAAEPSASPPTHRSKAGRPDEECNPTRDCSKRKAKTDRHETQTVVSAHLADE